MTSPPFERFRTLSIFLVFLTGITALIFQNTWHRYLIYLLGSQAQATAIIIAVFLGGMSVGYFLYGRLSEKFSNHLFILYGVTEFSVGVWAIFSPQLFRIIFNLPVEGFFSEIAVAILFLGIPTVLMGGTIPVLTQALSQDLYAATRIHSRIYAFNTFGAALGSLAAGFYLIPTFGLPLSLFFAGLLNVVVGFIFFVLQGAFYREKTERVGSETPMEERSSGESFRWLWVISLVSGFVTIGLETLLIRIMGLSIGSSSYTFSVIVAIFIFCIATGGYVVGRFRTIHPASICLALFASAVSLWLLYNSVERWPYATHVVRVMFATIPQAFPVYYGTIFLLVALMLVIPISLCGTVLPLCFHYLKSRMETLGSEAGKLYAMNTVGCVLGALLPGYILLQWWDMNQVFLLLIFMVVGAQALALWKLRHVFGSGALKTFSAGTALFFVVLVFQPLWDNDYLALGLFRLRQPIANSFKGHEAMKSRNPIVYFRDGPSASVTAFRVQFPGEAESGLGLAVNGKVEGGTHRHKGDFYTTHLIAHLPILFAGSPKRVCVIGIGTGITAGVAGQYKEVQEVDLVELNPMVIRAAPFFNKYNYNLTGNPKIKIHERDAFRFFREATQPYDVIISEPSNPWMVGIENLFSREFYEMASERLSDDGVFFQWIQGYALSRPTMALILNTLRSVFPEYHLFQLQNFDFGILATKSPLSARRFELLAKRLQREKNNPALRDLGFQRPVQFVGLQRLSREGVDNLAKDGGLHTLENPKLGYWAGKDFFVNSSLTFSEQGPLLAEWKKFSGNDTVELTYPKAYCRERGTNCLSEESGDRK